MPYTAWGGVDSIITQLFPNEQWNPENVRRVAETRKNPREDSIPQRAQENRVNMISHLIILHAFRSHRAEEELGSSQQFHIPVFSCYRLSAKGNLPFIERDNIPAHDEGGKDQHGFSRNDARWKITPRENFTSTRQQENLCISHSNSDSNGVLWLVISPAHGVFTGRKVYN